MSGKNVCRAKRRYATEATARAALTAARATAPSTAKKPQRAYHCTWCGHWHLTSTRSPT